MAVNPSSTQDNEGRTDHKSENHSEDYTELEAVYKNDDYESLNWNFKKLKKNTKIPLGERERERDRDRERERARNHDKWN